MSGGSEQATVLVVDDEQEVADVYALRLGDSYETRAVYGGRAALDAIDDSVDVVLLDRRMPDRSGDEVLAEIREREHDCRVIMLTAVDPGPDILDMPFDDYLCKPVETEDLVTAIEQQLRVKRHDGPVAEYFEERAKLALLERQLPPGSEELDRLRSRVQRLEARLAEDERVETLEAAFASVDRHPN